MALQKYQVNYLDNEKHIKNGPSPTDLEQDPIGFNVEAIIVCNISEPSLSKKGVLVSS